MLHFTVQLIFVAPLLSLLGLTFTEISTVEPAASPAFTQHVATSSVSKMGPLGKRAPSGLEKPCSTVSPQGQRSTPTRSAQSDMEFEEPFNVTLNSLNYIDRITGAGAVHYFNFNNSSALKITAKVVPVSDLAGTYGAGLR